MIELLIIATEGWRCKEEGRGNNWSYIAKAISLAASGIYLGKKKNRRRKLRKEVR